MSNDRGEPPQRSGDVAAGESLRTIVTACFEGYSWLVARRQLHQDARRTRRSLVEHLSRASDPSATTVYLEDSAALVGIAVAAAALILHLVTGRAIWDAAASMVIGLLLIVVAYLLVIVGVTVTPAMADASGRDLVDRVTRLRRHLLRVPVITEAAVTVEIDDR